MAYTPVPTVPAPPPGGVVFDDRQRIKDLQQQFTVEKLMQVDPQVSVQDQERHTIYLLLVMSLVRRFWNGNRRGSLGEYPQRPKQCKDGVYDGGESYLGHNIGAIAVDSLGQIIDFDFNHNEIFHSSMEHAEARLIRRAFSLSALRLKSGATTLVGATIYTSLEPCAQCAGVMALAGLREVIYLQPDDGALRIANVLYNMKPYGAMVLPVAAIDCSLPYGNALEAGYDKFKEEIAGGVPFWRDPTSAKPSDTRASRASFLCTDRALEQYDLGTSQFDALTVAGLTYGNYRRQVPAAKQPGTPLTNAQVLEEANEFLEYAKASGFRGTPH